MKILHFDEISSTNTFAKEKIKDGESLIVTASRQTGGRGTKGRSFSSNEGGVYLTKLTFYGDFPSKKAFLIMASAAVAVCKTLEKFSLRPVIKWANDVFVRDKKICGILIENGFSGERVAYSIVGIGINVYNDLPQELQDIATTVYQETGKKISVNEVKRELIARLNDVFDMQEYIDRVGYLGKIATITEGEKNFRALLVGVQNTGELIIEENGKRRAVCHGEVSLKI